MRHVAALILVLSLLLPGPALAGGIARVESSDEDSGELAVPLHRSAAAATSRETVLQEICPAWLSWWLGIIFGQDRDELGGSANGGVAP